MMHIEQVVSLYCGGPGSGRKPDPYKPPRTHPAKGGTNRGSYKTDERFVKYNLAWHAKRMQELMQQGLSKEEASSQAFKEMTSKK